MFVIRRHQRVRFDFQKVDVGGSLSDARWRAGVAVCADVLRRSPSVHLWEDDSGVQARAIQGMLRDGERLFAFQDDLRVRHHLSWRHFCCCPGIRDGTPTCGPQAGSAHQQIAEAAGIWCPRAGHQGVGNASWTRRNRCRSSQNCSAFPSDFVGTHPSRSTAPLHARIGFDWSLGLLTGSR